jgi:hypothetical protein
MGMAAQAGGPPVELASALETDMSITLKKARER